METIYFKLIAQKTTETHSILVAVVPNDMLGENLPTICEFQAFKMSPTVFTGTYPQIKVNSDTMKDRADLKGLGIAGILTKEEWYTKTESSDDLLEILLEKTKKQSDAIFSGKLEI